MNKAVEIPVILDTIMYKSSVLYVIEYPENTSPLLSLNVWEPNKSSST